MQPENSISLLIGASSCREHCHTCHAFGPQKALEKAGLEASHPLHSWGQWYAQGHHASHSWSWTQNACVLKDNLEGSELHLHWASVYDWARTWRTNSASGQRLRGPLERHPRFDCREWGTVTSRNGWLKSHPIEVRVFSGKKSHYFRNKLPATKLVGKHLTEYTAAVSTSFRPHPAVQGTSGSP